MALRGSLSCPLYGECLVEVRIAASSAFLLEEGESADPIGVAGGAHVPVDEFAQAAEVGILDGVGWMGVGARRRRGVDCFGWDVRMGLSTLWTPEGGVLGRVLIQRNVGVEVEGWERSTGGVEAVLGLEGAILGLERAWHSESGGLIDDILPVVSDTIVEFAEVLEGATPNFPVPQPVDVESGEDDVEVVCATKAGDIGDEEADIEAAVLNGGEETADDLEEGSSGMSDGAGVFVGVNIDEEGKDVAAELDEGEGDVGALRGIETIEIAPLVLWNEPTTAVHGSEVAGLALPRGEGSEEGVKEALLGRRPLRSFGGPVGVSWCVAWRTCAAGDDVCGHADRCKAGGATFLYEGLGEGARRGAKLGKMIERENSEKATRVRSDREIAAQFVWEAEVTVK